MSFPKEEAMPNQNFFLSKKTILCVSLFAILVGCSKSSVSPDRSVFTITPGEDLQIVDAYFNGTNGQWVNLVVKNTRDFKLPSFTMDYSLSCDNGYKIYDSEVFTLASNEQDSRLFLVTLANVNATSCTLTITAIRPQYHENYIDWTGAYPVQIQQQNTEASSN